MPLISEVVIASIDIVTCLTAFNEIKKLRPLMFLIRRTPSVSKRFAV